MKKFFFIIFCAAFIISGCKRNANHYSGTKWSKSFDSHQQVLSFTDNEYNYYVADINGNYDYLEDAGTYTYGGDTITFSSNHTGIDLHLRRATVSGNMITVLYSTFEDPVYHVDQVFWTIDLMKN